MKNKIYLVAASLLLLPVLVGAEAHVFTLNTDINTKDALLGKVEGITNIVFTVAIVLAVIMALYAAFLFITAAGDVEKVTQARQTLIYAAIGVGVAVLAGGFPFIVSSLLGVDLIGA